MNRALIIIVVALVVLINAQDASAQVEPESEVTPDDVPSLEALSMPTVIERIDVIEALGQSGEERAVPILTQLARSDPSEEVRTAAVRGLAQLGTESAHAAIERASRSGHGLRVREVAVELLFERATEPRARVELILEHHRRVPTRALTEALRSDPSAEVRMAALMVLGQAPSSIDREAIRRVIDDQDEEIGALAAEIIDDQRAERVYEVLTPTGGILAGSLYALNFCVGLLSFFFYLGSADDRVGHQIWKLMVPIAGGPVAAITGRNSDVVAWSVLGWLSATLQVAGLAIMSTGLIGSARIERRQRERQEALDGWSRDLMSSETAGRRPRMGVVIVPTGLTGLSIIGWFG